MRALFKLLISAASVTSLESPFENEIMHANALPIKDILWAHLDGFSSLWMGP